MRNIIVINHIASRVDRDSPFIRAPARVIEFQNISISARPRSCPLARRPFSSPVSSFRFKHVNFSAKKSDRKLIFLFDAVVERICSRQARCHGILFFRPVKQKPRTKRQRKWRSNVRMETHLWNDRKLAAIPFDVLSKTGYPGQKTFFCVTGCSSPRCNFDFVKHFIRHCCVYVIGLIFENVFYGLSRSTEFPGTRRKCFGRVDWDESLILSKYDSTRNLNFRKIFHQTRLNLYYNIGFTKYFVTFLTVGNVESLEMVLNEPGWIKLWFCKMFYQIQLRVYYDIDCTERRWQRF